MRVPVLALVALAAGAFLLALLATLAPAPEPPPLPVLAPRETDPAEDAATTRVARVRGRVVHGGGGVAGALVVVREASGRELARGLAVAEGSFELELVTSVPPASLVIVARHEELGATVAGLSGPLEEGPALVVGDLLLK